MSRALSHLLAFVLCLTLGCTSQVEKKYQEARRLRQADRLWEAIDAYQQAVRTDPDHAEAHWELGQTLVRLQRHEEAIPHLQQAARLLPERTAPHLDLGQALRRADRPGQALQSFQRARALEPSNPWPDLYSGQVLLEQTRYAEAERALRRALARAPDLPEAHESLADVYYFLDRMTEAIAEFETVIGMGTSSVETWMHYGLALDNQNRTDEAIRAMKRALEIQPKNTDALFYLGQLYWRQQRWADVVDAWEALLREKPDDETTRALLRQARQYLPAG